MAEVLVTGGDTEIGRTVAAGYKNAGHHVVIAGARRDDLEITAKELEVESMVFDNTDPASLAEARSLIPHHLDILVNVPGPQAEAKDPRTFTLSDHTRAWHNALNGAVVSAALTVQVVGDHLRSGGSIVSVVPDGEGSIDAAIKAALGDWTAEQAGYFGTRGITINAIASGLSTQPGYDGLCTVAASVADGFARLALFLSTPAARHITGQTLHVSGGALAPLA